MTMERSSKLSDAAKKSILDLHISVAETVPAYAIFLDQNNASTARTIAEVTNIPVMSKANYLRHRSLESLTRGGDITAENDIVSVSSGSSGVPFYWPRGQRQHKEAADIYFKLYKNTFAADRVSTLLVVSFSMGSWIAGTYTAFGGIGSSEAGLKLNVVTPSIDSKEVLSVIKMLSGNYEQVLLAGYPPFVRDLLSEGSEFGIDWAAVNVGFTFAGEMITEKWRDNTLALASCDDIFRSANVYGTADMGIVGHETPLSIALKRKLLETGTASLVSANDFSLVQYDKSRVVVEQIDGSILLTADAGIPLVRYEIGDSGGVLELADFPEEVVTMALEEVVSAGYDTEIFGDAFIFVEGRKDMTCSLYAVLVYPEHIKEALEENSIQHLATGRFQMETRQDKAHNQYLYLVVEVNEGVDLNDENGHLVRLKIDETLQELNGEYRKLKQMVGKKAKIVVHLVERGNQRVADRSENKQRWVKSEN